MVAGRFSDPRLRYEPSQRNLGRAANYRRGLYELARGEWVLNLDGDDFLVDRSYVRAAIAAVNESVVLAFADRFVCFEEADPLSYPSCGAISAQPEYMDGTEYVLSLPRNRLRMNHLTALYRRAEALAIDFYRADIVSCDYESIFRICLDLTLAYIPARVAVWRRHPGNASRAHDVEQSIGNYQLFQGIRDFAVKRLGDKYIRRFDKWLLQNVANRFYGNALSYCRKGDLAGLRKISRFLEAHYPVARRKAIANPKKLMRCLLAFALGIATRILSNIQKVTPV
jgi:glycosyltransferase involved in cell wall biosynthesis